MEILVDNYLINLLFSAIDGVDISFKIRIGDNVTTGKRKYTVTKKYRYILGELFYLKIEDL